MSTERKFRREDLGFEQPAEAAGGLRAPIQQELRLLTCGLRRRLVYLRPSLKNPFTPTIVLKDLYLTVRDVHTSLETYVKKLEKQLTSTETRTLQHLIQKTQETRHALWSRFLDAVFRDLRLDRLRTQLHP